MLDITSIFVIGSPILIGILFLVGLCRAGARGKEIDEISEQYLERKKNEQNLKRN